MRARSAPDVFCLFSKFDFAFIFAKHGCRSWKSIDEHFYLQADDRP
jgi:hypothetical protein